jgi:RND family efflux transporter MFP subunit
VDRAAARAALARAESEFQRAKTEVRRQRTLREQGVASQARIDDAENAFRVTEAARLEARARLERAERDLARTELRAPFQGRVRSERIDVGQFVNRGEAIATLYAVDYAEVLLPVPDRELRFVDVPLLPMEGDDPEAEGMAGPEVRLRAEFAGRFHEWLGHAVRTGGEIDPKTRMVQVVARVRDPYARSAGSSHAPLAVGLFVEAEILGRTARDVFVLPREALHQGDPMDPSASQLVHVVDAEGRLRIRPVEVLRTEPEHVVIGEGLTAGERVSISGLRAVADGMRVRAAPLAEPAAAPASARDDGEPARTEAPQGARS